jgi:ribonuclease Z
MLPRDGYEVRTFRVRHGRDALGYALVEQERPGRFDVATADALGVPSGRERGELQGGTAVRLADGREVTPEQVLGEARPGRKVVLTGDTAPSDGVAEAAFGADLLVHEATFCEDEADRARETEHSTALEAARVAVDAHVRLLALTHVSSRYGGGDVEREARTIFPDTVVPRDFDLIDVPFPERGTPELVKSGARVPRAEVPSGA